MRKILAWQILVINEIFGDMNVRYSKMFYDNPTSRAYKIIVTSNYKVIAAVLDFLNLEISVYCFYHVLLLITVL